MAAPIQPSEPLEPRSNTELLGHEVAERQFLDAWNGKRLAHAWLIAGPRGIGKATLAYRIARFVLASGEAAEAGGLFGDPPPPESLVIPPESPVFRRIAANGHPDFRVFERETDAKGKTQTEIPVDKVRGLGDFLALTPAEGGWRVAIVDSADELNRAGANAILKLLEEPPRNALIILISHSPDLLLPTIRSRCLRLVLRPLPDETVIALLRRRLPEISEADALAIARLAEGSIGAALALAEGEGLELYRELIGLIGALPRYDIGKLHSFADRVGGDEEKSRTVEALYLRWLAAAAAQRTGAETVAGEGDLGRKLVAQAGLERWLDLWDRSIKGFERAEAVNLDRKQVLLNTFLALERAIRP